MEKYKVALWIEASAKVVFFDQRVGRFWLLVLAVSLENNLLIRQLFY